MNHKSYRGYSDSDSQFYICFFDAEILSLYCSIEMLCSARRTLRVSDLKKEIRLNILIHNGKKRKV